VKYSLVTGAATVVVLILGSFEVVAGGTTTAMAAWIIPWLCGAYANSTWYFTGKFTMSLPLAFAAGFSVGQATCELLGGFPCCRATLAGISTMVFVSQFGFIFAHLINVSIS